MNLFKITRRDGKKSTFWYGKVRVGAKAYRRVKLYQYKPAAARMLAELQAEADQRASGMKTAETDRLALPLTDLVGLYIASLRARKVDEAHVRITEWSLTTLVDAGKWQRFGDITAPAVEAVLPTLAKTAGYQNAFIKKVKAFIHWALPDDWPDPLRKLKRVRQKGAKQTRARRAASVDEAGAFFAVWPTLPPDRHLCYALAMLNGLRRNEIKRSDSDRLLWRQLHLDAAIPFIDLRQKMGDGQDSIPLHPYVVKLLRARIAGMPGAPAVGAVPDMKTMKRDLELAGIALADERGLRLDFHALRHSFQTALDRTGCSRATKKKLMRHAAEDVTDGYAHAELAEMVAALMRLPSPESMPQQAVMTGTDALPITVSEPCENADHRLDHGTGEMGQNVALTGTLADPGADSCRNLAACYNPGSGIDLHESALNVASDLSQVVAGQGLRPSTQVD